MTAWRSWFVAVGLAAAACGGGGDKPEVVPLVWHRTWDGTAISIDANGSVRDGCGEVGRLDPVTGSMRFVRGQHSAVEVRASVGTRTRAMSVGDTGRYEVRGHTVWYGKTADGEIEGYADTEAARLSFDALAAAASLGQCMPSLTLTLDAGGYRLTLGGIDHRIRDGTDVVATWGRDGLTDRYGASLGWFDPVHAHFVEGTCFELRQGELAVGPYAGHDLAVSIDYDGRVGLVRGAQIGRLEGYDRSDAHREVAASLAVVALAKLTPAPPSDSPPDASCE
jgi:hypothetical protein